MCVCVCVERERERERERARERERIWKMVVNEARPDLRFVAENVRVQLCNTVDVVAGHQAEALFTFF